MRGEQYKLCRLSSIDEKCETGVRFGGESRQVCGEDNQVVEDLPPPTPSKRAQQVPTVQQQTHSHSYTADSYLEFPALLVSISQHGGFYIGQVKRVAGI